MKPGFEVMEWDQGIYETLPVDRRAFRRIKERQVSKEAYGQRSSKFDPFTIWAKINRQADIDFP